MDATDNSCRLKELSFSDHGARLHTRVMKKLEAAAFVTALGSGIFAAPFLAPVIAAFLIRPSADGIVHVAVEHAMDYFPAILRAREYAFALGWPGQYLAHTLTLYIVIEIPFMALLIATIVPMASRHRMTLEHATRALKKKNLMMHPVILIGLIAAWPLLIADMAFFGNLYSAILNDGSAPRGGVVYYLIAHSGLYMGANGACFTGIVAVIERAKLRRFRGAVRSALMIRAGAMTTERVELC